MISHPYSVPQIPCACTMSVLLLTTPGHADSTRSSPAGPASLSAACQAYGTHIGGLIADHKEAQEVSTADLEQATTLFYVGASLCSLGFHEKAIATYDRIMLGRVQKRLPFGPSGK